MYISRFSRIDTVTIPGKYLSVVELSPGDGYGVSVAEVANTVHGDRDALDGVMFTRADGELLELEGLHRLIREVRPTHLDVVITTSGSQPERLDDLIGAGYADHVIFTFAGVPDEAMKRSLRMAHRGDCTFSVVLIADPGNFTREEILENVRAFNGATSVVLKRPKAVSDRKAYRKNEMTSMAKSLRGVVKEVRVF